MVHGVSTVPAPPSEFESAAPDHARPPRVRCAKHLTRAIAFFRVLNATASGLGATAGLSRECPSSLISPCCFLLERTFALRKLGARQGRRKNTAGRASSGTRSINRRFQDASHLSGGPSNVSVYSADGTAPLSPQTSRVSGAVGETFAARHKRRCTLQAACSVTRGLN